jgi:hypothetical protein
MARRHRLENTVCSGGVIVRDCIFLLADLGMVAAFKGFFSRQGFYYALGTALFYIDPQRDIICDCAGNDPGVYTRAHELLRTYQSTHRYAVIVLDNAWEGSPGLKKFDRRFHRTWNVWDGREIGLLLLTQS